jgi:[acyl-carrier-protein] S-malonyltransferase
MSFLNKNSLDQSVFAVFPGQGSQHVGMAKDLYEQFSVARQVFEEASDAIRIDLKKLCFEDPNKELILTENTQPCLLTASVAAYRVAEKELDFKPGAVAGHSLGEYSALVAVGCLNLGTAAQWVRERGLAMQKAVPAGEGGMAAILGLDDSLIGRLCSQATELAQKARAAKTESTSTVEAIVEPANFNAPGQIVIAGSSDGIQQAIDLMRAGGEFAGAKAIPLQVSAPFHCRLMQPARDRMADLFAKASSAQKPRLLKIPYVPNRTGRLSHELELVLDLLIEQVDHPVLWKQSIEGLLQHPFRAAVEFGPGKVLNGLIKRIASQKSHSCTLSSMSDSSSIKNLETLFKELETSERGENRL